ncbi:hypothetical protein GUITHDRAFT_149953 [Guillardia theta CCMP2712]|uniref:Uncharacterized protein n=2 Tax=Guillardia theta TaxID=55529 RepID=L1K2N3_GUITC|nr:hypothetical protein GUITHDRAFT_149953 [Guillardia theta CCMP2712]EKX55091.1 hypothetical protein GUITHDRAFT_149953 [Guillardia theta CCMP2712]|eukprot:XP_005842071.1 hypothetical protein GUITHDRAFT_149953 [Guillardia theta CCMP2712]
MSVFVASVSALLISIPVIIIFFVTLYYWSKWETRRQEAKELNAALTGNRQLDAHASPHELA